VLHLGNLDLVDWQGLVLVGGVNLGVALAESPSVSRHNSTSGDTSTIQVTLLEGSALLRSHDDLAPEPVAPPQDAHLLNGHPLGLRQEAQGVHSHAEHPEGEEDVGAVLQAAHTRTRCQTKQQIAVQQKLVLMSHSMQRQLVHVEHRHLHGPKHSV